MRRVIGIGQQDFGDIRRENLFYVDKTAFIREWWENRDCVTLITRPRRFWKDTYYEYAGIIFFQ